MDDDWFIYQRTAGRISARPVGFKGWLSLVALTCLPLVIVLPFAGRLMAFHPLAFVALLLAALGLSLGLLFKLILAKGRRVSNDG